MICYRDMTFCAGDGCQRFDGCPRALTEDVRADAQAKGLPIMEFEHPKALQCFKPKNEKKEDAA